MEKRIFQTYVGTKFRKVEDVTYIRGRISGIMFIMCGLVDTDPRKGYPNVMITKDDNVIAYIMKVKCTQDQYDRFTEVIENTYPGLCKFDWKNKRSDLN